MPTCFSSIQGNVYAEVLLGWCCDACTTQGRCCQQPWLELEWAEWRPWRHRCFRKLHRVPQATTSLHRMSPYHRAQCTYPGALVFNKPVCIPEHCSRCCCYIAVLIIDQHQSVQGTAYPGASWLDCSCCFSIPPFQRWQVLGSLSPALHVYTSFRCRNGST